MTRGGRLRSIGLGGIIGIVLVLGLSVYVIFFSFSDKETKIRFITVPVEKGALTAEINCTGTLRPVVEVLVGSQVSGTVKELHADFETRVEKDQLIALIDPATSEAKVAQARADLEAAGAALVKAKVTLIDELRTLSRNQQLLERSSISQSEFDTAKTRVEAAEAQIAVDQGKVAQAEAKLLEAELQVKYTRIVAPVKGVVTSRNVDVGQTVAASFQSPELFKIAEDLRKMQVNTNVDEADIGRVREGQPAVFTVPAFPDHTFSASVIQIRNEPKVEQNVVTYNVVLGVDNTELKLRPGMTAIVRIILHEVNEALTVSDQALRFNPSEKVTADLKLSEQPSLKPGEKRLWKVESNNTLLPITVKTGIAGLERTQIFSNELKPGDKIAVETAGKAVKESVPRPGGIGFRL